MLDFTAPEYDLTGGRLRVSGEHGPESEAAFEAVLDQLLDFDSNTLVVDLTDVTYISSGYVRMLAFALMRARKAGRELVIKVNKRVARLMQMGGIDQIGTVELVNGD